MNRVGKWETGCAMLSLFLFKLYTSFPHVLIAGAGTSAWISTILSGIIFFTVASILAVFLKHRHISIFNSKILKLLILIYTTISLWYVLTQGVTAIKESSYPDAPVLLLSVFIAFGSIIPALRGRDGVMRLLGIVTPLLILLTFLIILFGLKGAEPLYLTPVLGNGTESIFKEALRGLLVYTDIILLPFILMEYKKIDIKRPLLISAGMAAFFYTFGILATLLGSPYEVSSQIRLPLYSLALNTYGGETFQRLDLLYLFAICISTITSSAIYLYIFRRTCRGLFTKKTGAVAICMLLFFSLFGCSGSSEVEENAYIAAIGIDKGEAESYKYTFRFANRLKSGSEGEEKDSGDYITIECENLHTAVSYLERSLGKKPNLSHLFATAFSVDVAREGIKPHIDAFDYRREIRPDTKLLLTTGSAEEWIKNNKPKFEGSISRYYKLLLRPSTMPYAPAVELYEFKNRLTESGIDPVMPIADNGDFMGMGCFADDKLTESLSGEEAVLYNLYMGENTKGIINTDDITFGIKGRRQAKLDKKTKTVTITLFTETEYLSPLSSAQMQRTENAIKEKTKDLIYKARSLNSDIFGISRHYKKQLLPGEKWDKIRIEINNKRKIRKF